MTEEQVCGVLKLDRDDYVRRVAGLLDCLEWAALAPTAPAELREQVIVAAEEQLAWEATSVAVLKRAIGARRYAIEAFSARLALAKARSK